MSVEIVSRAVKIICKTEDGVEHECTVRDGAPCVIGRGKDVALHLDFKSVSRQHCQLELGADGHVEVVDLGSQNGTRVNGRRVERAALKAGDELMVATVPLRIVVPKPPAPRFDTDRLLSPEERRFRRQLEEMGLDVVDRVDLGSPVPVYRAHRRDLEQDVLVKAVQVDDDDPEAREQAQRLLRAAKVAAKLRHRNIVQIYDVRQIAGVVAIILELVEGRTLAQELRKGAMEPIRALSIAAEVCRALEHAHGLGVVHRGITPGTIMVAERDEVKLVDFLLAKSLGGARGPALTVGGLGDAEYAPPEQVKDASAVDARADVYALGATLYHALTGEAPRARLSRGPAGGREGEASSPLGGHSESALLPAPIDVVAPGLPEAARNVVTRAMKSRRDDRYGTAEQMRLALEGAIALLKAGTGGIPRPEGAESAVARFAASTASRGSGTGFVGRIQIDELIELLQMVEYNRKTGVLEMYGVPDEGGRRVSGVVTFRDGGIVHAKSGEHRGTEALFELFMLPGGNFRVIYGDRPPSPEDQPPLNISATIMELMRRRDESKREFHREDPHR